MRDACLTALPVADTGVSLQQLGPWPSRREAGSGTRAAEEEVNGYSWRNLELEDILLSETSQSQDKCRRMPLCEVPRVVKSDTGGELVGARGWGVGV